VAALERLAAAVEGRALNTVVRWAAATCAMRSLTSMIQGSAMRISSLVCAVKGFTHMDQANAAEPVDLGPSLANTVTVLTSKAREKSVTVTLELEPELPKVRGFAAELNQVWGNLIDNALDAVEHGGCVDVLAIRENETVVVRIRDDGPGIPAELCDCIFDPFFTTKPLGHGTGLGLDIARRLARHNEGTIDFESHPGRTEFRVRLPIAETNPANSR
jgi:signal transduction histidine kinase